MRSGPESSPSVSKPVIGLAGGIGSGKSTVARLMAGEQGYVIEADALAREALQQTDVKQRLQQWWGDAVFDAQGAVDRRKMADRIFHSPEDRHRLEALIHPLVQAERRRRLDEVQDRPEVRFIVLDVPLLFEVGINRECDLVVFVEADRQTRLERLERTRGWDAAELDRREKSQWPLDRKREQSDAIIVNNSDEAQCLAQVRALLSRVLPSN